MGPKPPLAPLILLGIILAAHLTAAGASSRSTTPMAVPEGGAVVVDGCEAARATGDVLVQSVDPSGSGRPGLTVIDPFSASVTGRIAIPSVSALFTTRLAGRALAVAGADLYLVDTGSGTAMLVPSDVSARNLSPNPVQFRGSAGQRYLLLGSPSFDATLMVDVDAGIATNLTALIVPPVPDAPVFIPFAAVTPDDAHVLLWDGRHVYVVDTGNPEGARRVGDTPFAFAPDSSPDGREIVYSRSDGPGSGSELVLEAIDGSAALVIKSSPHALVTLWVPGGRSLLVDERTEAGAASGWIYLLDIDTGRETPVLDYEGSVTTVQFDPDGAQALLGVELAGSSSWHLADLTTGSLRSLPQLTGSYALPGLYADSRWALAVPSAISTDPIAGPSFRGVDLSTGVVGRLLVQPAGVTFTQPPKLSRDGGLSLVTGVSETQSVLWLLDAPGIRAHRLADGTSVSGVFAPEACHIAVSTERSIDGIPSLTSSVVPLSGAPELAIGGGRVMAWIESADPNRQEPSGGPVGSAPPAAR